MNRNLFTLISRLIARINHNISHTSVATFITGKWHCWQLSTIQSSVVDSRTATIIFRPHCGHSWIKLSVCLGQQPLTETGIFLKYRRRQRFFALPTGMATAVATR